MICDGCGCETDQLAIAQWSGKRLCRACMAEGKRWREEQAEEERTWRQFGDRVTDVTDMTDVTERQSDTWNIE